MRTKPFELPQKLIAEFFQRAEEAELEVQLTEITEDGELAVEVHYEDEEKDEVMNLIELVDDYYGEEYEEEEEEESER